MTKVQTWALAAFGGAALVIGVLLATGALSSAQTPTPSPSSATPSATTGAFKSNEDPAHEAGESAEREAQENSGQFPGGHRGPGGAFKSNEDPAHEAQESATREAQENAQAQATPAPTATPGS